MRSVGYPYENFRVMFPHALPGAKLHPFNQIAKLADDKLFINLL